MNKFFFPLVLLISICSCSEEQNNNEEANIANDFEPKIMSNTPNEPTVSNDTSALVLVDVIEGELSTELPNSFAFKGVSPQNPGVGVKESKLFEYVEPGNQELTFFFIKTIYESKDQTIDSHYEAVVNGPRIGSDRKFLEKISIGNANWLYEQYEMNEPNGTPVMYDDFIYIDQDKMYGMIVCCNTAVYSKWETVIMNAKDKLTVN